MARQANHIAFALLLALGALGGTQGLAGAAVGGSFPVVDVPGTYQFLVTDGTFVVWDAGGWYIYASSLQDRRPFLVATRPARGGTATNTHSISGGVVIWTDDARDQPSCSMVAIRTSWPWTWSAGASSPWRTARSRRPRSALRAT